MSSQVLTGPVAAGRLTSVLRRYPLVSFFVLVYSLSWGLGALLDGQVPLAPDGSFVAGPLVAALLMTVVVQGRSGLRDLGRRLIAWRVGLRWYAVVFALPVALVGCAAALIEVFGGSGMDFGRQPKLIPTALTFLVFLLLPVGAPIAEEVGWRGFALPRLLAGRSPLVASMILGVIWSLWHLPVIISNPALRVPVPFLLAVIPLSVLTTWLFLKTGGSVFIAVLFHAWFDIVLLYFSSMIPESDYSRMWWMLFLTQSLAVAVLLARRGFSTGREARPQTEPLVHV